MARLVFTAAEGGTAKEILLSPASTLLIGLMKAGASIRHDCGGKALCGTCRIKLEERGATSPMREKERLRLEALGESLDGSVRLACQTVGFRDLAARGLIGADSGGKA